MGFQLIEPRILSVHTFLKAKHHVLGSLGLDKRLDSLCRQFEQKVVAFGFGFQISGLVNLPMRDEQNTI